MEPQSKYRFGMGGYDIDRVLLWQKRRPASIARAIGRTPPFRLTSGSLSYGRALSRPPSEEEKTLGRVTLSDLATEWGKHQVDKDEAARRALATYCHTIINSAVFLYID